MPEVARIFSDRQAFWTSQGFTGRAVFDRLASDSELPNLFNEGDAAAIAGLSSHAMKQRRARGMQPTFLRLSSRCVRYPRESICQWLAEMLHSRAT